MVDMNMNRSCHVKWVVAIVIQILASLANASAVPCAEPADAKAPWPAVALAPVADGFTAPLALEVPGDASGRLFVVEQAGKIRILKGGARQPGKFLDIEERVRSGGEMGLLGLAFHPKFTENGRFYLNYTSASGGLHSVIAEYRVWKTGGDEADPGSERILLTYDQPWENHNGGGLAFGPDGFLYIGTGDGGAGNDPRNSAQNLGRLLGKMLRIDVDRKDAGLEYAIPGDNPFRSRKGARAEVWAYGLRNPWRYSFDRVTGWLWAGDVGQDALEEVDIVRRAANYGWRRMEGMICTPGVNTKCDRAGLTLPVLDYTRKEGNCITGGHVYRGAAVAGLCGAYVFGDFATGRIWGVRSDGTRALARGLLLESGKSISAFGRDEAGELYVMYYGGAILKIVPGVSPE